MPQSDKDPIREVTHTVEEDRAAQIEGAREGRPALFTCSDCGGTLWQVNDPEFVQFRCHVGHVLAGEQLFADQLVSSENALWRAIRTLEDRTVLGKQLAADARDRNDEAAAMQFQAKADHAENRAKALRAIAENRDLSP